MVQLHISRLTTYSLKELKAIALENNIHITGDKRRKSSYIDSITQWELHNSQPEPAVTTVEFTYDAVEDITTSTITGDTDAWLSDAYNSEPTEEELLIHQATQLPNVIEDIWLEQDITLEKLEQEVLPWEQEPTESGIPTIILPLLIPFLLIGLVVIGIGTLATALIGFVISTRQAPVKAPTVSRPPCLYTKNYNKITLRSV